MLSGKRVALVGFTAAVAETVTNLLTEADVFARGFSLDIEPGADTLKPFELMLINIDAAQRSKWLNPDHLGGVADRSIGLGTCAILLSLFTKQGLPCRECCIWPASRDELFLRCLSVLRFASRSRCSNDTDNSKVVLADDDPSITSLVRLTLQRSGLTCEVASNGAEALSLIEKWKPCAVVLDIGMPGMDGFEVLSRLRSNTATAQTKVILLTGCEQEMDIVRGFTLGADDYVTKPFNPMEVLMRLKRVIGRI
jgi:CheY-like chemotaxis protein